MTGKVVSIDVRQNQGGTSPEQIPAYGPDFGVRVSVTGGSGATSESQAGQAMDATQLYKDAAGTSGLGDLAHRAIGSVVEAEQHLRSALSCDSADDFASFDTHIMRAGYSLRRAFAYRQIGDGFGACVNAMMQAIINREPPPMSSRQISVLLECISHLKRTPFLHYDTAMRLMDEMEDASLNIDPVALNAFLPSYE